MEASLSLFEEHPPTPGRADAPAARLVVVVYGEAAPAGSKRSVMVGSKDGPKFMRTIDANPKAAKWKDLVAQEAGRAMAGRDLLRGALEVTFTFFRRRPKGHFRTNGGVRPSAPGHPTTRPDATKLVRGVEDALTGVVWNDDAQIVAQGAFKCWGEPERVVIVVRELP